MRVANEKSKVESFQDLDGNDGRIVRFSRSIVRVRCFLDPIGLSVGPVDTVGLSTYTSLVCLKRWRNRWFSTISRHQVVYHIFDEEALTLLMVSFSIL